MKRSAEQEPGTIHPQRSRRQAETAEEASSSSVCVPEQPVDLGIDDVTLCVDSDTKKQLTGITLPVVAPWRTTVALKIFGNTYAVI